VREASRGCLRHPIPRTVCRAAVKELEPAQEAGALPLDRGELDRRTQRAAAIRLLRHLRRGGKTGYCSHYMTSANRREHAPSGVGDQTLQRRAA